MVQHHSRGRGERGGGGGGRGGGGGGRGGGGGGGGGGVLAIALGGVFYTVHHKTQHSNQNIWNQKFLIPLPELVSWNLFVYFCRTWQV